MKNISFGDLLDAALLIPAVPPLSRGALRGRHERWVRDAVDASGAADESANLRTAKSCGPDAPTLAFKSAEVIPLVTVTTKPGHRGEHEGTR